MKSCCRLLLLCWLLALTACGIPLPAGGPVAEEDPADPGCSYFYFLWGSHAEANRFFPEALEAYQKALICDPQSAYIKEKIPLLLLKMEEYGKAIDWLNEALSEEPNNLTYHLLQANLYIRQNKYPEAIRHYGKAEQIDPDNPEVLLRLGLLYGYNGQFRESERLFRRILRQQDGFYAAHLALARLLRQTERTSEAAASYEQALRLNWSKELAYELAQLYRSEGFLAEALRVYTTITDNDHLDERAALSRIQTLLDLGDNSQALRELRNLRGFTRTPDQIDIITSKVLLRLERPAPARELLKEVTRRGASSEARYMLALLAFQEGDQPTALDWLQQIAADSAEFEEALYLQVRILEEMKQHDRAIALLEGHLRQTEGRRPILYSLLAALRQRQGKGAAAIALLAEAVAGNPDNPRLLFDYGMALERQGLSTSAVAMMERVLQSQPDHPEALNFIGYTWADEGVNLQQAREYIERANRLRPDNGFIIDSLGWVYYRLGRLADAARELERAQTLVPDDPNIHDHLGDVYRSLGRHQEALAAYRQALLLFSEAEKKAAMQEKIDALPRR